jgi:hypothetical protein
MPIGPLNLEYLNLNSQRAYPLTEFATKQDTTGTFTLPSDFLIGAYFPVHTGLDVIPGRFFLSSLAIFGTGFNIGISYFDGTSTPPVVAAAVIARTTHTEYRSYALPGQGNFSDSVGRIILGRLDSIDAQPAGSYTFDYADGALEEDAIRPMIRDVRSLVLLNGNDRSDRIQGDVELQAGTNISLTPILVAGQDPIIRIDAIDGAGLDEECICLDDTVSGPIKTINGIPPDAAGDFKFIGDNCLIVEAATNGIKLIDNCSDPCCGSDELDALSTELDIIGSGATTVEAFINKLQAEVTQFSNTVLGSTLSDDPCIQGQCP